MSLRIGDFLGRSVVRRILVFAVVALLYSGFATAKASAYPFTTTSYYESTTSTSTLQTQGCNAGGASASGVIILDFGRPAYNAGAYGTILFGSGGFATNTSILNAMKAFADGYYACSPAGPVVTIARGTNDSYTYSSGDPSPQCPGSGSCSYIPPSYTSFGSYWGQRTNDLASYISTSGYSAQENAAGAIDDEPAWDPGYTNTKDIDDGYDSAVSQWIMVDFGSDEQGYWSNANRWHVAYYGDDLPIPQIYQSTMASQWEGLDLWAVTNEGSSMLIWGAMSQYPSGYTAHQAYDAMLGQLRSNWSTYQANLANLTNI